MPNDIKTEEATPMPFKAVATKTTERDAGPEPGAPTSDEPPTASVANRKAGYRSWKKKYRKMRVEFEKKMQDGDALHRREQRARGIVKKLALQNDQLLDILLEINNSPQIPPEKRIDLSLSKANTDPLEYDMALRKEMASKRLQDLLADVPHSSYAATKSTKSMPQSELSDLVAHEGEGFPLAFMSADDVDDAFYEWDVELSHQVDDHSVLPTLAPAAHPDAHLTKNLSPQLANPVSVTNWLRKNAPKIFLQDTDTHGGGGGGGAHNNHDDDDGHNKSSKSRSKASQASKDKKEDKDGSHGPKTPGNTAGASNPKSASSVNRRKRPKPEADVVPSETKPGEAHAGNGDHAFDSTVTSSGPNNGAGRSRSVEAADDEQQPMDEDTEYATPVSKGKRKRDDDPGYRPKGGTSRPKKKRKSEGAADKKKKVAREASA